MPPARAVVRDTTLHDTTLLLPSRCEQHRDGLFARCPRVARILARRPSSRSGALSSTAGQGGRPAGLLKTPVIVSTSPFPFLCRPTLPRLRPCRDCPWTCFACSTLRPARSHHPLQLEEVEATGGAGAARAQQTISHNPTRPRATRAYLHQARQSESYLLSFAHGRCAPSMAARMQIRPFCTHRLAVKRSPRCTLRCLTGRGPPARPF